MHEKGVTFKKYDIRTECMEADEPVLELFEITKQTKVLKLERLGGSDAGPIIHFISYFHPRIGLTGEEDFSKPLDEILEIDYHTVVAI